MRVAFVLFLLFCLATFAYTNPFLAPEPTPEPEHHNSKFAAPEPEPEPEHDDYND